MTEQGKNTHPSSPEQHARSLLTPREKQVLQLFAEGYTAETAGAQLGISQFTVIAHANKAVTKLGALNRTHAVITALRLNELVLDQAQTKDEF